MNERIRELAKQAEILITEVGAFHNTPQGAYQLQEQHMEKFAELIVRECAQVSEDDITDGDACCTNTAYRISRQIKKHFGVEQ
jgi:hypothetical protein